MTADALSAKVTISSLTGHKLPSGVGFRRAFVAFSVLDQNGETLWESGRTNAAGVLVDAARHAAGGRAVVEGRLLRLCAGPASGRTSRITRRSAGQDQAQIYQELVSTPPGVPPEPICDSPMRRRPAS